MRRGPCCCGGLRVSLGVPGKAATDYLMPFFKKCAIDICRGEPQVARPPSVLISGKLVKKWYKNRISLFFGVKKLEGDRGWFEELRGDRTPVK